MSYERNMKWLIDRRINYRCDPVNDKPTIDTALYSYYEMVHMNVITCFVVKQRLQHINL